MFNLKSIIKRESFIWYNWLVRSISTPCLSEDTSLASFICHDGCVNLRNYKLENFLPLCTHGSLLSNTSIVKRLYVCEPHSIYLKLVHVRHLSNASIELKTDEDVVRFNIGNPIAKGRSQKKGKKTSKRFKLSRKAKLNELRFFRLKAKKKMNSPNPEVRIRYKLEKAKRKEELLIEKLRKYEVPKAPQETYDPEILTEEEKFYLKRTGEKKKNYVPVGRRGVFGGVVLNMHLHWKKHETVKVICKPCKPGQIHQFAEELARLSKGIVIDIKPNDTIIFYRGKNYVRPDVMSPPDTLSKAKALEKYRYEQSLEHTSQFIEKLENELEEYHKHLARYKKEKETAQEERTRKRSLNDAMEQIELQLKAGSSCSICALHDDLANAHNPLKLGGPYEIGGQNESQVCSTCLPVVAAYNLLKTAPPIWSNAVKEILEDYVEEPSSRIFN